MTGTTLILASLPRITAGFISVRLHILLAPYMANQGLSPQVKTYISPDTK